MAVSCAGRLARGVISARDGGWDGDVAGCVIVDGDVSVCDDDCDVDDWARAVCEDADDVACDEAADDVQNRVLKPREKGQWRLTWL